MLTRRGFIGIAGTSAWLVTAGCRPPELYRFFGRPALCSDGGPIPYAKRGLVAGKNLMIGYPINMETLQDEFFIWRNRLVEDGIGVVPYNNVGNPYRHSLFANNTHDYERELILRLGELYAFSRKNVWGFVSNSGTDSNMQGMYMGRTLLKARTGTAPKAYFTREAHYSVEILRDLLGLESVLVETGPRGGMEPEDLALKLARNADHPALVIATVGTTFKGAIDPIDQIRSRLRGQASYLHVDAALFGGYFPYTSHAHEVLYQSRAESAAPRYESLAVSCHKFFGFPAPAGLFITTKALFEEFNELFSRVHNPEYIHQVPGTIMCSRDAVKPAEFFFFSTPCAKSRLAESAKAVLENTQYLYDQMRLHFQQWMPTRADQRSNIVYFKKPGRRIARKYSLCSVRLESNQKREAYSHVVVMPHVTKDIIAQFLTDLQSDSALRR